MELIFLLLIFSSVSAQNSTVESELICSRQPIVAQIGDDVILPCHLEPPVNADFWTVLWTKPGLYPKYVHFHQDGRLMFERQNRSYYLRTRLFVDELPTGNVSMKIFGVKVSDAGEYQCVLPSVQKEASIQLVVGAASTPVIVVISNSSSSVDLQCESKGWYPEPEVLWLDGEGNLVSAGPTEKVLGPDHLYAVSSRATVEKRRSNSFTCRVQQKDINQTREAHIQVSGDAYKDQFSPNFFMISLITILCVFVALILIVQLVKLRREILKHMIGL
ncbi:butyrophilin subfamily 2 member A2-like isoform X2 [Pempheris klunzingeri]|uniref:butyrophilin subfamily 2 member A2-like isoform X2 n=1 Tax=Pempheris klunzingeri TaxID=3127111 RepID=UPI00397FF9D7